jgi:hypothetical protein
VARINNIVLVHGGFVDGSGWAGVYELLKADGYNVSIVQNRPYRLPAMRLPRGSSLTSRMGRRCSSVTRTAAR